MSEISLQIRNSLFAINLLASKSKYISLCGTDFNDLN